MVVDIDGVLADVRPRLRHLAGPRKDWASFFAAVSDDVALPDGVSLVREMAARHEIIYLTGRPEQTRRATEGWLARNDLPTGRLIMRRIRDHRPASVVKPELLAGLGRRVALVIDDDPAVCDALEALHYPVLRADWMERTALLDAAQERDART